MTERKISLLYDGIHFRVTLPIEFIKEKGWKKGDKLLIKSEDGYFIINKLIKKKSLPTVFSIGYEGKSLKTFIEILQENSIKQLIDIRELPLSRKRGFSKNSLKNALREAGIIYNNIKELGTDKKSREKYKETGDLVKLLGTYHKRFNENKESYELLKALIYYKSSAIMCFEDNYQKCHRQFIEEKLKQEGIRVKHLCNGKQKKF